MEEELVAASELLDGEVAQSTTWEKFERLLVASPDSSWVCVTYMALAMQGRGLVKIFGTEGAMGEVLKFWWPPSSRSLRRCWRSASLPRLSSVVGTLRGGRPCSSMCVT